MSDLRFMNSKTSRGFDLIEFEDQNQNPCELQQSSAIDDTERGMNQPGSSYVWLGVAKYPERMHLHREHVTELITVLRGWLETGKLVSVTLSESKPG